MRCIREGGTEECIVKIALTQDGVKMKPDADFVSVEVLVVITFTRRSMVRTGIGSTEHAGDVQVHKPGECEPKQGPGEDEPFVRSAISTRHTRIISDLHRKKL